ncbi:MAG: HAD-IIA family hydrolase [Dehalococcoidales bacterium]
MEAVILAAGMGSRLRSITETKPKCMVKVSGIPIIEHQIKAYLDAGIDKINVIIGYRNDIVLAYLKSFNESKINIVFNLDYEITNNMYSLYLTKKFLFGKEFILSNGDVVFDDTIINDIVNNIPSDRIACDKGSYDEEAMKIMVNEKGFIKKISKKIMPASAFGNSIDLYKFSNISSEVFFNEITKIIEVENNINSWVEVGLDRLLDNGQLKMRPFDISQRPWVEIDNIDDLLKADKVFSSLLSLKHKKLFLIDLDGTVYIGDQVIPGASDFISTLKRYKKHFYFMSNNSSKSKKDYVRKLKFMDIKVSEKEIILSTDGVIDYLLNGGYKNVYVLGTNSMKLLFKEAGFNISSTKPQCVILGYDTELTYHKLIETALLLQQDIKFFATHCDMVCPTPQGPIPDIGSFLALLKAATGKIPDKIFGKPNIEMVVKVLRNHDVTPKDVVIIADRLYTDMELAKRINCDFICVLSGETRREDIEKSNYWPLLIVNNIGEIVNLI